MLSIEQWREDRVSANDIVVVARTFPHARTMAKELGVHGIGTAELRDGNPSADAVRISTMHGMKGLEFRCVGRRDRVRHALDV